MIQEVNKPKEFFDSHERDLEEVVGVVRRAFGRQTEFQDIYQHVTSPEKVYLLRANHGNNRIEAMASYNSKVFAGIPSLIVEGIVVDTEFQGKGVFAYMTDKARDDEDAICLRTQNPRMYRALQKYCDEVFPNESRIPKGIEQIRNDFAEYLNCEIDKNGIVKGYYGGLFYGEEPHHKEVDPLFKRLGLDLRKGDALLVVGRVDPSFVDIAMGMI